METVTASYAWPGPDIDVLRLYVEPQRGPWLADPVDGNPLITVLREVDAQGRLAGLEIVGFSTFDDWELLPEPPLRWQLAGQEPMALRPLLATIQAHLQAKTPTARLSGARATH